MFWHILAYAPLLVVCVLAVFYKLKGIEVGGWVAWAAVAAFFWFAVCLIRRDKQRIQPHDQAD